MTVELREQGEQVGKARVARLMREEGYRMNEMRLTGLFPGSVALPDAPTKGGPRSKTE